MLVKIYFLICALGLLIAAVFYLTGNLSPMMRIVFGFLTFSVVLWECFRCFRSGQHIILCRNINHARHGNFRVRCEKNFDKTLSENNL